MKSPFGAYLLKAPATSEISLHLFLLFEGSRAPIFAQILQDVYTGVALQEWHTNVRNVILTFWHGSHFSISWSPGDCDVAQSLTNLLSFHDWTHEKQKKMWSKF